MRSKSTQETLGKIITNAVILLSAKHYLKLFTYKHKHSWVFKCRMKPFISQNGIKEEAIMINFYGKFFEHSQTQNTT